MSTATVAEGGVLQQLLSALESRQNADGGWGYHQGAASRLEPTAWAVLALDAGASDAASDAASAASARAAGLLVSWQRADGLLAERSDLPANMAFNGLAALVLHRRPDATRRAAAIAAALERVEGVRFGPSPFFRQDNSLTGWPWIDATFSWIEPTAWCLLAVKKLRRPPRSEQASARIEWAERLFVDRACRAGGWNSGNSNSHGAELAPYVPTTALGLLAMRDRPDEPAVSAALEFLRRNRAAERSGLALGLASLCLRVYGDPIGEHNALLEEGFARTGFLGNTHVAAIAACALSESSHVVEAIGL